MNVDDVEDPIEAENWVDDHGRVVPPDLFVGQFVAQELVFCRRDTQTCEESVCEANLSMVVNLLQSIMTSQMLQ